MGSVWRADHLMLGTEVAIKVIDPLIADSAEAFRRFRHEAQAAAELRSAHIVQIMDYGIDQHIPFIVMELLEGESLAQRLARVKRLTASDTAHVLLQVARGLGRAHSKGIVHRDLKPDNIFIACDGNDETTKLLDFGIAKRLLPRSLGDSGNTSTGAILGTPYYMSPEQAMGHSNLDHRSDIWSFGIIAFECLTGSRPFQHDTLASLLMAICQEPAPVPSTLACVPPGFDAWFTQTAARDVADRFDSIIQAALQLQTLCEHTESAALEDCQGEEGLRHETPESYPLHQRATGNPRTAGGEERTEPVKPSPLSMWLVPAIGLLVVLAATLAWKAQAEASRVPTAPTVPTQVSSSWLHPTGTIGVSEQDVTFHSNVSSTAVTSPVDTTDTTSHLGARVPDKTQPIRHRTSSTSATENAAGF